MGVDDKMNASPEPSDWMGKTKPDDRRALARKLTEEEREEWPYHWRKQGREAQFAPPVD